MRLSIFSSDRSSFRRTWRRTWLVALLLAATGCLATELFWRWQGFTPSASDTKGLWAYHRSRATREDALVLIGASRTQTDLHLDTLAEFFPDRPILQLAVAGRSPIATLEELSRDDDFRGDLICGVAEPFLEALSKTRVSIRDPESENPRYEHLASWIFLGIGFLGQSLFGVRFFLQWIASERKRAVVIPRAFWWFSIGGAIATGIYSVSILAYPIILSQGVNCLIYSRSLYLSYEKKDDHEISLPAEIKMDVEK